MDLDVLKEKIRHGKLDVNGLDNALLLRFQSLIIHSGCNSFASLGICFFSCTGSACSQGCSSESCAQGCAGVSCAGGCTKGGTKN